MTVTVKIEGVEKLTDALTAMPPELRAQQRKAVSKAMTIVQEYARTQIHSPGGHAAKGIVQKITGSGATIQGKLMPGVRPNGLATIFAQRSTGPNRTPPPVAAIAKLARSLGINPYALARSIGKKGTVGHPIMREALEHKRVEVVAAFTEALRAVAALARQHL